MKKLCIILGLVVFALALDIKLGSTSPRHTFSSSEVVKNNERNKGKTLPYANIKRDSEVDLLDAYLERATLCTNTTDYAICSHGNATFASGNKNYQHNLIFNPNNDEFFLVYIQESGTHTSILGQLMDDMGNPIGDAIGVVTYGDNPGSKHNPRVAYSTIDDVYFVVFDYLTVYVDGTTDEDVGGMFVAGNGTKIGEPFYVGTSAIALGADHNARVAFNIDYNCFLVVHEHAYDSDVDIILQPIFLEGDNSVLWDFGSQYNDTDPDIVYNPTTALYYLVWTTTDPYTSDIYGIQVTVDGEPYGNVAVIGDTTFFNGTTVRDHNAILVFEQTHQNYLVLFEVDLEGTDVGPTNILGVRVDIDGNPQDGFAVLGSTDSNNGTFNKNPSVAYGNQNDEYVVAYEALVSETGVSTIRAVVFAADDLTIKQDLLVSDGVSNEYFPAIGYDTQENKYLIMWNHGDVASDTTTGGSTTGEAMVESAKKKSNAGAIAGGVIGGLAGVGIIAGVAVFLRKRQRTKAYELHSLNEH